MKDRGSMQGADGPATGAGTTERLTQSIEKSTRPRETSRGAMPSTAGALRIMNAWEVASALDCDVDTVNQRAAMGDFPGLKIGRSWAFPVGALEDRLNEMARLEMKARKAPPPPVPRGRRATRGGPPSLD
jgi:hypothetical protein